MPLSRRRILCKLGTLAGARLGAQGPPISRAPDRPVPVADKDWYRHFGDYQSLLANGRFDVVFLGDSLTEFWSYTGKAAWEAQILPFKALNGGVAADRTEHVLWRIQHSDFHRARPRLFVLLMGTNNLAMTPPDSPESVANACLAAARSLLAKQPSSKVLLLGLPPNGLAASAPLRERIKKTDALLEREALASGVSFLPLYATFVDDRERWREGLTLDGTHFSAAGYAALAELLVPRMKELLGSK